MRADNTTFWLRPAVGWTTAARAADALERLPAAPDPLMVARLAQAASVSRSWIYTQPELLERSRNLPLQ